MSVIIKGMAMPSSCADCNFYIDAQRCGEPVLSEGSFCAALNIDIVEEGEKDENCPLVEIPSGHGELVDLRYLVDRYWDGNYMEITKDDLDDIPTILEAEGEE